MTFHLRVMQPRPMMPKVAAIACECGSMMLLLAWRGPFVLCHTATNHQMEHSAKAELSWAQNTIENIVLYFVIKQDP